MIIHISKEFELELNAESVKTLAVALVAVCGVGFAMKMAVGNLLKFILVIRSNVLSMPHWLLGL